MIYANEISGVKNDLTEILEAIGKAGVPDDVIKIGAEYLDISKPKDVSLLKKIKQAVSVNPPKINGDIYEFRRKVRKHIERNNELFARYVQFCFSAVKSESWKLCDSLSYCNDDEKVKKIFAELVSDEEKRDVMSDAMVLAVRMDCHRLGYNNRISTEVYFAAAFMSTDSHNILLFLIYALESSAEYNDMVKMCIEIITDTEKSGYHFSLGLHRIAISECACFDDRFRPLFRELMGTYPESFIEFAVKNGLYSKKIYKLVIDENIHITEKYLNDVISYYFYETDVFREHLRQIAIRHEKTYVSVMKQYPNAQYALEMLNILREVRPEYTADDCGLREIARKRYINAVYNASGKSQAVYEYITGKKPLDEVIGEFDKIQLSTGSEHNTTYYDAYGIDDVVRKVVTACYLISEDDDSYYGYYSRRCISGFNGGNKEFVEMLFTENAPVEFIINHSMQDNLVDYAEKVAQADTSKLTADGRHNYIWALGAFGDKYKEQIFAMTGDTSKTVKEVLVTVISKMNDCETEIADMLSAKKAAVRETALEIMAKKKGTDLSGLLRNALEKEKSNKLKVKIMGLLGMEQVEEKKEVSEIELAEKLTKGSKGKKVAWLYQSPYHTVHFADGSEVPEKYMQALLICYTDGEYPTGKRLAEKLSPDNLAVFAEEVLGRWIDAGAVAKNKWVLIFSAVYGKSAVITAIVSYIRQWSENMRGALAVAAVKALALNGSSEALMQVDSMARKYKSNQVKSAAKEALIDAAEFLGITIDELSDRIVPDFDFDERMCRVFDYGDRKFSVYLTPSLEIEIYNGDKKIKNLPKPSANDNAEIAGKSYADFKEMKKQLKSAVKLQTARLEYTLMCERKWTAENWKKLFVKNPLMHCFAVGLIWGIYEDGRLVSCFRYLDDGSFTTSDEEEFEIPENAEISLVHPVELSEDELSAWTEQLKDYEIVQPFAQLSRPVYCPTSDELNEVDVKRFYGKEVINQTLTSRMEKNGWYRGVAQDGGCFYEFCREDVSRKIKDSNGKSVKIGYGAELSFSGEYIGVYQVDAEDVDIENLSFYKADNMTKKIPVSEVSDRYFSEIVMQLTAML